MTKRDSGSQQPPARKKSRSSAASSSIGGISTSCLVTPDQTAKKTRKQTQSSDHPPPNLSFGSTSQGPVALSTPLRPSTGHNRALSKKPSSGSQTDKRLREE
ncbi:hypothetical protein COEREDRAFT_12646, partial [Coemansia reversa NRRL 1564]